VLYALNSWNHVTNVTITLALHAIVICAPFTLLKSCIDFLRFYVFDRLPVIWHHRCWHVRCQALLHDTRCLFMFICLCLTNFVSGIRKMFIVKGKEGKGKGIAVCENFTTSLQEITCHMGLPSVTCHPAEVTFPPSPQPKLILDLATPKGCKAELTIRWSYRWLCHVSATATQHSQDFLRLSSVDFSLFSMPPPDWYIYLLGMSTSHQYCLWSHGNMALYKFCIIIIITARPTLAAVSGTHWFQISCAHLPMPARPGATVSFRLHPERRRLWSSSSSQLVIRRTQLSTVSDRAFPVAGCRLWNSLPPDITSALALSVFRNRLKTHLFFPIISFLTVFGF